ncbi:MAG: heavy metal-binding domain-containing protein [Saprospiraceae bacterium]
MKQFKIIFFFAAILSLGLMSCGNKAAATTEEATTEVAVDTTAMEAPATDGIEYTSAFICPMHCAGSGSAEAGKCPACGMDYVANADHKHEGGENHTH